jgi:hypothetical protein
MCDHSERGAGDPRLAISEGRRGAFAHTKAVDHGTIQLLRRLRGAEAAHPLPLALELRKSPTRCVIARDSDAGDQRLGIQKAGEGHLHARKRGIAGSYSC